MLNHNSHTTPDLTSLDALHNALLFTVNEICDTAKDVTRTLKSLKQQKDNKNSFILSSISEGVIITDKYGMITESNYAMQKLFGYDYSSLKNNNICDFISVNNKHENVIKKSDGGYEVIDLTNYTNIDDQIIYMIKRKWL